MSQRRTRRRRRRPILTDYERSLQRRVQQEEITPTTKRTKLTRANVIFEVCLRSLTTDGLEALIEKRFRRDGHGPVIKELQALIDERDQEARRSRS